MHGLLSMRELDRSMIDRILSRAERFAEGIPIRPTGPLVGLMFYSDSLRTRVGFEAAAARLGGTAFVVTGARHTRAMSQPESMLDAVRSVASWCDVLCIRHPDPAAVPAAAGLVSTPVINCGNGSDEHPTQALIDLFAIDRLCGGVDGVRLGLVGDLHGMRVAHSLMIGLSRFTGVHVRCMTPPGLEVSAVLADEFQACGNTMESRSDLSLDDLDVVYVAGLTRQTAVEVPDTVRDSLSITTAALQGLNSSVHVLCPLPRIDEIGPDVDVTPHAAYFRQSALGLPVRMAILEAVTKPDG